MASLLLHLAPERALEHGAQHEQAKQLVELAVMNQVEDSAVLGRVWLARDTEKIKRGDLAFMVTFGAHAFDSGLSTKVGFVCNLCVLGPRGGDL